MLAPIFTHGTYENTIKAIQEGKIKYPSYLWISDRQQYGFLNKHNQLEVIGIPEFTGTLDNVLILSTFNDGLYQIKGVHKITAEDETVFSSGSNILVVIQTIDGVKKIRRITADDLSVYTINPDLSVSVETVATDTYLEEHGYATEGYVDNKIEVLKLEIENEIEELVTPIIRPIVEQIIDEEIIPESDENIEELFE